MVGKNRIIKMLLLIIVGLFWINLLASDVHSQINRRVPILDESIEDFDILLSSRRVRLYQGQSSLIEVRVIILGNLEVKLSIENCSSYILCQLNQTEFSSSGVATLKIITMPNTPPGKYNIIIKGEDNRSIIKTKKLELTIIKVPERIIPPPIIDPEPVPLPIFDFNISVFPDFVSLVRGGSRRVYVNISIIGNIIVQLGIEGCPANSICQLNQTEFSSSGVAELIIFSNDPAGTYEIYVVGKAEGVVKIEKLTLQVNDYELIYSNKTVVYPGDAVVVLIYGKKYGIIERVELSVECNYGIFCTILGWHEGPIWDFDRIYYLGIIVPEDIPEGIYPIKLRLYLDDVEREYIKYLEVRLPYGSNRLNYTPYTQRRINYYH